MLWEHWLDHRLLTGKRVRRQQHSSRVMGIIGQSNLENRNKVGHHYLLYLAKAADESEKSEKVQERVRGKGVFERVRVRLLHDWVGMGWKERRTGTAGGAVAARGPINQINRLGGLLLWCRCAAGITTSRCVCHCF